MNSNAATTCTARTMGITWEDGEIGHHREDDLALVCRPYRHGKRADDSAELGADE